MKRTEWALLLILTLINCTAAIATTYVARDLNRSFQAEAEPIGKLGRTILDALREAEDREAGR